MEEPEGDLLRLGIIDDDAAFVSAICVEAAVLGDVRPVALRSGRPQVRNLTAARLTATLVDPDACGPDFWTSLESVCEELPDLSVLVCSGRADLASRVRGLRLGADDWITKPVAATEVLARVEAAQRPRRCGGCKPTERLRCGELEIRPDEADVRVAGVSLGLTAKEFELLAFLIRGEGKVFERGMIYRGVWGSLMASEDRSVYTYIRRLRIKLQDASPEWDYIHSRPRLGYLLEPRRRVVHPVGATGRTLMRTSSTAVCER